MCPRNGRAVDISELPRFTMQLILEPIGNRVIVCITKWMFITAMLFMKVVSLHGTENVGCLYDQNVCELKKETCFDDGAFGRCVSYDTSADELYQYNLSYDDLEQLKQLLSDLHSVGFKWEDEFTQCVIQTQLYSFQTGIPVEENACNYVLKSYYYKDPVKELKALEQQPPADTLRDSYTIRPQVEGIVRYMPDTEHFRNDKEEAFVSLDKQDERDNDLAEQLIALRTSEREVRTKKQKPHAAAYVLPNSVRYRGTPLYVPKSRARYLENEDEYAEADGRNLDINSEPVKLDFSMPIIVDDDKNQEEGKAWIEVAQKWNSGASREPFGDQKYIESKGGSLFLRPDTPGFPHMYNRLLEDYKKRLDVKKPGPYFSVNNYIYQNMLKEEEEKLQEPITGEAHSTRHEIVPGDQSLKKYLNQEYAYVPATYPVEPPVIPPGLEERSKIPHGSYISIEMKQEINNVSAADLMDKINGFFHFRPLDRILTDEKVIQNKLVFKVNRNRFGFGAYDLQQAIDDGKDYLSEQMNLTIEDTVVGNETIAEDDSTPLKEEDNSEIIHIYFDDEIRNAKRAKQILRRIEELLRISKGTLSFYGQTYDEIMVKVDSEDYKYNISAIVSMIGSVVDDLKKENIYIRSIEVETRGQPQAVPHSVPVQIDNDPWYILLFATCGLLGALVVSVVAWCIAKRHIDAKGKLHKIIKSGIKDHSKDYQLCRSRMAGKPSSEASTHGQRITSLSREPDNSSSSRSSTSSWSEDPVTNMDITTGHMVLSYMEDHLVNKARLDTEWAALCVYEADPCSTAIAQMPENMKKNRYINVVPYDHARVILNALSNFSGSDYINASTITDHDPRNPAYIATQGPLAATCVDFWQMIWEQGCVVIVMLTRLVESDVSMCHRYWPLEGSELYNIYEVHLVSEHIWCDDFLVRSFYLKNLKTTETRTVTQFHFLTWPEGGIPPAAKPLLEFRRKVNKSFRGRSCPIVVHCSDGAGRTGCYLLLDMVLNRISKGAKEIDIAATLEHIRDQRCGAVSTKQQFQFVLSAVAEEVQAILRALPQQQQSQEQTEPITVTTGRDENVTKTRVTDTIEEEEPSTSSEAEKRRTSKE